MRASRNAQLNGFEGQAARFVALHKSGGDGGGAMESDDPVKVGPRVLQEGHAVQWRRFCLAERTSFRAPARSAASGEGSLQAMNAARTSVAGTHGDQRPASLNTTTSGVLGDRAVFRRTAALGEG